MAFIGKCQCHILYLLYFLHSTKSKIIDCHLFFNSRTEKGIVRLKFEPKIDMFNLLTKWHMDFHHFPLYFCRVCVSECVCLWSKKLNGLNDSLNILYIRIKRFEHIIEHSSGSKRERERINHAKGSYYLSFFSSVCTRTFFCPHSSLFSHWRHEPYAWLNPTKKQKNTKWLKLEEWNKGRSDQ